MGAGQSITKIKTRPVGSNQWEMVGRAKRRAIANTSLRAGTNPGSTVFSLQHYQVPSPCESPFRCSSLHAQAPVIASPSPTLAAREAQIPQEPQ